MHELKIKKLFSFAGMADILGRDVRVEYAASGDTDSNGSLVIKDVSRETAQSIITHLSGVTVAIVGPAIVPKLATAAVTPPKPAAPAAKSPAQAKPAPAPPKPAPAPPVEVVDESEDVAADLDGASDSDDGLGDEVGSTTDVDPAVLKKAKTLREVFTLMIEQGGCKTAAQIVAACERVKDVVPALKEVDEKGGFAKRIERGATVVLSATAS